jgi:hypothetical protein
MHIVRVWAIRAAAIALATSACSSGERRTTLPGALTKPLEQYSGDEFYALVQGLTFTGGVERQRHCREAGCEGPQPTRSVQVRIDAVDTQDSLSAQTLPSNGVVAARATNRGGGVESLYGMRGEPGVEYYLVLLPVGQTATWRLVELTTSGQRAHKTVATGTMVECGHPFVRGARADFKTCAEAAAPRPAAFGRLLQGSDPPIWISCASGCCTADSGGHA